MTDEAGNFRRVVVKLGTSVLTAGSQRLDRAHMVELVRQLAALHRQGVDIVLVSSGAVAAGREHLGYPQLADAVAGKQMLAAVGQSHLMLVWEQLFNIYGLHVGQMLLTRADLEDRERFLNARDTLQTLLKHRIVPIINENDAVAIADIKVGDNDNLSARVGILADADLLLLLTDIEGLYTADPRKDAEATLINEVCTIDDNLKRIAGGSVSGLGTGGMFTKLQAAEVACRAGIKVVIAPGHRAEVVTALVAGEAIGTAFIPQDQPLEARKKWLFSGPASSGQLRVDAGAVRAMRDSGSSLLPTGITKVSGGFGRGEVVEVLGPDGSCIGRGLVRYSAKDLARIQGCHSAEINERLGFDYGAVAIHRDDLVLL